MRHLYEQTWGWNEQQKREELFGDILSQYILIFDQDSSLNVRTMVGFAHFKFEFDDDGLFSFVFFCFFTLYFLFV